MVDDYTRVLEALAESADEKNAEEAVSKLITHLKSTGRIKLLAGILQKLKQIDARRQKNAAYVEVAHAGESATALEQAAKEGILAEHAHVNPSLVKGFRARKGGILLDRSAKRALIDLYQNLTV